MPGRRAREFTDASVAALKPRASRYSRPDPDCRGLYVRVTEKGAKSYCAVARDPLGKQIWTTLGSADHLAIEEARSRAREAIKRVKAGLLAVEPPKPAPELVKSVAENWLQRHVRARGLRSAGEIERVLRKHVFPSLGERQFTAVRRGDIALLLDRIEDGHGSRIADIVLAHIRSVGNWYAARTEDYVRGRSPKACGGMRTTRASGSWTTTNCARSGGGRRTVRSPFTAILRLALLTAQRREKIASMRWSDVTLDGVWSIPVEARQKGTGGALPLPAAALDIVRAQPWVEGNEFVFPGRGAGRFNGFSPCKRRFEKRLPAGMPQWGLHDLRRTARSLMSRAGVSSEHAERVMGHSIPGVEGVYDRHRYDREKGQALAALAALIEEVVHGGGARP